MTGKQLNYWLALHVVISGCDMGAPFSAPDLHRYMKRAYPKVTAPVTENRIRMLLSEMVGSGILIRVGRKWDVRAPYRVAC